MKYLIIAVLIMFSFLVHSERRQYDTDILAETFKFNKKTKKSITLDELYQGCPKRDCIVSIDKPIFITNKQVDFLNDNDVVIVVNYNNETKAYPLGIMQHHEIVNDHFGEQLIVVSYCPLCASAVAFIPKVQNKYVEFGVSGVLHNNDLVMYDRRTNSLWGQITATAIVGPMTGERLKRVYASQLTWKQAQQYHSDIMVLMPKKDTGDYSQDHYQEYAENERTIFPLPQRDARLFIKERVFGLMLGEQPIAILKKELNKQRIIKQDRLTIAEQFDGSVIAWDSTSQQLIPITETYWFAWYNFHPKTALIGN